MARIAAELPKSSQSESTGARVEYQSGTSGKCQRTQMGLDLSQALLVALLLVAGQARVDSLLERAEYFLLNRHVLIRTWIPVVIASTLPDGR